MLTRNVPSRGFTLVELLVVIAIISILAGFLIPTIMKARGRADEVRCQSNLRELQKLGMMYADGAGTRFYPLAKGSNPPAHDSLNVLVRFHEGLKPELFICPTWREEAAEVVDGKFTLEETSCAYTWPKRKVSTSDRPDTALSCDKHIQSESEGQESGHPNGRNVVYLDSSVKFVLAADIPEGEDLPRNLTR